MDVFSLIVLLIGLPLTFASAKGVDSTSLPEADLVVIAYRITPCFPAGGIRIVVDRGTATAVTDSLGVARIPLPAGMHHIKVGANHEFDIRHKSVGATYALVNVSRMTRAFQVRSSVRDDRRSDRAAERPEPLHVSFDLAPGAERMVCSRSAASGSHLSARMARRPNGRPAPSPLAPASPSPESSPPNPPPRSRRPYIHSTVA